MTNIELTLGPIREELISELEGNILEVGSGTGTNFKYYNAKARVIAIEPSSFMLEKSKVKIPENIHIRTFNLGIDDIKLNSIIDDQSLDFIVCTLVLCTIPNQNTAFDNFKKWLKPSGKLIILEHIHAQNKPMRFLYNLVNPVWRIIGEGCNLNRDTDDSLKKAGFTVESEQYFKNSLDFYQGVFKVSSFDQEVKSYSEAKKFRK
ncbi:class I SAM-dependent methyltransferase [Brumimicrobium oceani]|nr:class I SAM-dependent methyltransferase [Brumimicrobium oceani]